MLGGALGDALGAPVEFMSIGEIRTRYGPDGIRDLDEAWGRIGAITDDTQMALFTAEGALRARTRAEVKGMGNPAVAAYAAYQRWLRTQTEGPPSPRPHGSFPQLDVLPELYSRRAPGNTCLSALESGKFGSQTSPINDSKGCGGVMRVAPVGLAGFHTPFEVGCRFAAVTHGHPSGWLAAGALALIVHRLVEGSGLLDVIQGTVRRLADEGSRADETRRAIEQAVELTQRDVAEPEVVERLGGGWVAEEALAIGLFASLSAEGDVARGLRLAVNHSGDSDSTGAIAGNILGASLGEESLPTTWLARLELVDVIERLADDLVVCRRSPPGEWTLGDRYPMD